MGIANRTLHILLFYPPSTAHANTQLEKHVRELIAESPLVILEQYAGIICESGAIGANKEDCRTKALVVEMEVVLDPLLKGRPV